VRRFDIYEDPERDTIEAVKHGFAWPAFVFTWVWAFSKGLPLHGAVLLAAWGIDLTGSRLFDDTTVEDLFGAVPVAAALWAGAFGNDWRRTRLERNGALKTGSIEAPSPKQAIRDHESADGLLVGASGWDRSPLP
jgi:hypothetical protein